MAGEHRMMGLFRNEGEAAAAVRTLGEAAFRIERVHGPVPGHRLAESLGLKKSRVGYFTLCGGIIGFFTGFLFAIFTATRWSLIVSGKPVVALVPFLIVGFEFTILFAVFGNIIGFLFQADMPRFGWETHYDPRVSGEHFGILVPFETDQEETLSEIFERHGGEIRRFDD